MNFLPQPQSAEVYHSSSGHGGEWEQVRQGVNRHWELMLLGEESQCLATVFDFRIPVSELLTCHFGGRVL